MAGVTDRADAEAADAADALAPFRGRFVLADDRIYLDGNSLGRLPVATRDRLAALAAEWGEELVSGWPRWIDAPVTAGDAIAEVIGARPGEVIACDSTTVNLYKLVGALVEADEPRALVIDRHEFPTDRYVVEGFADRDGLQLTTIHDEPAPRAGDLIVLSHVNYRTGALRDLAGLQAQADAAGARVIWDLSHSAGAVPVELHTAGAQFAVG